MHSMPMFAIDNHFFVHSYSYKDAKTWYCFVLPEWILSSTDGIHSVPIKVSVLIPLYYKQENTQKWGNLENTEKPLTVPLI